MLRAVGLSAGATDDLLGRLQSRSPARRAPTSCETAGAPHIRSHRNLASGPTGRLIKGTEASPAWRLLATADQIFTDLAEMRPSRVDFHKWPRKYPFTPSPWESRAQREEAHLAKHPPSPLTPTPRQDQRSRLKSNLSLF